LGCRAAVVTQLVCVGLRPRWSPSNWNHFPWPPPKPGACRALCQQRDYRKSWRGPELQTLHHSSQGWLGKGGWLCWSLALKADPTPGHSQWGWHCPLGGTSLDASCAVDWHYN
jgi:hypothetical protein